jgi:circadian clock protein KaiB
MYDDARPYERESQDPRQVENPDVLLQDPFRCDLEEFVDYVAELAGETRRRSIPGGRSRLLRAASPDRGRGKGEVKLQLVLYTSRESERSQRAVRTVQEVLSDYDASQVRLKTCDLANNPEDAEEDSVVFTPMLVKQGPGPRTAIIGNLEDREVLRELLDANGVERRTWDD